MSSSTHAAPADWSALLPGVVLEVRQPGSRAVSYPVGEVDFLIGSLPGCDLRVGGTDSAAVICLLARHPAGVTLRKLAPAQTILVNSRPASHLDVVNDDCIQLGAVEIRVHITPPAPTAPGTPALEQSRRELQERVQQFRAQLVEFQNDKAAFDREKAAQSPPATWQAERTALMQALDQRDQLLAERSVQIATQQQALADAEARAAQAVPPVDAAHLQADLEEREQALAERRRVVDAQVQQHAADLLRLDRWQATLEQREKDVASASADIERLRQQLQQDGAELETQVRAIDEWRAALADEAEKLEADKKEHAQTSRQFMDRIAALEGQQATLSALRSRLERIREEMRVRQQQLDEQHADQEAREAHIAEKTRELLRFQTDVETDRQQHERDRQQWLERSAVIEAAVQQMTRAQERLTQEDERVRAQGAENDRRAEQLGETEKEAQARLVSLAETRERLDLELNALRDRSVNLVQREQACETLQEQLRRRSEEIGRRHQELADQLEEHQVRHAELEERQRLLDERAQQTQQQFDNERQDLDARIALINKQHEELAGFEERYQDQLNQIAIDRRLLADEQAQFQLEQRDALEKLADERTAFAALKAEAAELLQQLPDAELRAGTALDRLSHARAQMREHLSEIHRYVRQCRDELEQVRVRLQTDLDKLREEEESLRRGQDEHRHAMTAFRQQLIDWQGQIAELRRLLTRDETRLEHKKVQADERARAMEAESERLAKHAEVLEEQERDVADRRHAMDQHLVDMRDWYRRKLRDLAGVALTPDVTDKAPALLPEPPATPLDEDGEPAIVPVSRSILSLSGSTDPGDQKLGDVMRDSQLIDADTLTALLAEARRQRRSLRQVLLASGVITLYQLALIEAGNMHGLMLGPVRVVDRLRHSALETVYRVFDPRRGTEAVLRHLSEACASDSTRVDDFRKCFEQAKLNDPHLANTLEVFDLLGRPAVLQEWLAGLPATDWPPLTAAPGVCYRLLTQASQGLAAAHQAGVVHGRLSDAMLLLTGDGVLKITGIGDPAWLVGVTHDDEPTPRADLRMLGTIVSGWCTPSGVRKGAKTKPLPDALVSVLYRLAADGAAGYHDVGELLLDLEKAGSEIPPNAEAWDRLLKYVREHGASETMVRRSA